MLNPVVNELESERPLKLAVKKSLVTLARGSQIASDGLKRGSDMK